MGLFDDEYHIFSVFDDMETTFMDTGNRWKAIWAEDSCNGRMPTGYLKCSAYKRGSTGSDSIARTAKTHS